MVFLLVFTLEFRDEKEEEKRKIQKETWVAIAIFDIAIALAFSAICFIASKKDVVVGFKKILIAAYIFCAAMIIGVIFHISMIIKKGHNVGMFHDDGFPKTQSLRMS